MAMYIQQSVNMGMAHASRWRHWKKEVEQLIENVVIKPTKWIQILLVGSKPWLTETYKQLKAQTSISQTF